MANIDDFLNAEGQGLPAPQPQQQAPPAQQTQIDPNIQAILDDNMKLREEFQRMREEMERQRAGVPPPPPVPVEDPWQTHVREALREARIGANEFVESPMETFVRASAATMKKAQSLWSQDVVALNSSMRLDTKFEDRYPDLYSTDAKKKLVQVALAELRGDPKFSRLLGATETIPQALDLVAESTYKMMGIDNPHKGGGPTPEPEPAPPPRKGTYGMPGGSRMTGEVPVKEDTQAREVGGMIRYLQGGGHPGV